MKRNTSTDYAIRMMLYLAEQKRTVSSTKLAEDVAMSTRYAMQVIAKLRDGGIVNVREGMSGGYCPAKPANEISPYDIIFYFEEPVGIVNPAKANDSSHDALVDVYTELVAGI